MDFIQQLQLWEKGEILQSKIMIGIGILILGAFISIFRSQNELLRGMLIPLALLLITFIGYGSFILYSRPVHVKESISLYEESKEEAIQQELKKHTNDNKTGNTLLKIYPILALLSIIVWIFVPSPYYKGMAIGFTLLFLSTFIMDSGFVTRSDKVIQTINNQ